MKQSTLLKAISNLTPYQRKQLEMTIIDVFQLNEEDANTKPEICPCCKKRSRMIKKGFNKGKQRYQCKECMRVFNYDSQTITSYLKIEQNMFMKIVIDTLNFIPVKKTAANLDVSIQCVFENRHKFLCALEILVYIEDNQLSGTIEIDETFELQSEKGTRAIYRKARKRGGPSNYRGLSQKRFVSSPQQIEKVLRYLKQLALENQLLIVYKKTLIKR